MEVFLLSLFLIALSSFALFLTYNKKKGVNTPPGSSGWPILGELLEFLGKPENFVRDRMEKYSSQIFKTSLLWEPMAVFCGPAGNKFLFSNENKLVQTWWPTSIQKIFTFSLITSVGDKAKLTRRLLMTYLKPEALQRYVGFMDAAANRHMQAEWECKGEVKAFHLIKLFTFYLACSLFTGIEDPDHLSKLIHEFNVLVHGLFGLPLNLPGMRLYRSMRAAEAIRKDLYFLIQQKRVALSEKAVSSPETQDLLSYLIVTTDEEGRFMTEREIVDNILVLLFAGHDTSSSTLALVLKYLAEMPHIYNEVLKEQPEIARSKAPGKLLDWGDLQKMRYTWNVVNEVMRLSPAVQGAFREAIADFKYAGYAVPKDWKVLPPGSFGWPIIGEFMDLQRTNRSGKPDKFITERMERYNKHIFKTSLFGEKTTVLCGPAANKLLFSSEKKLVQTFWPPSLKKLFGTSFFTAPYNEAIRTRKLVTSFLKPEVLSDLVGRFDSVCKKSIREDWAGKEQVMSYSLIKKYAFAIACEVFASINDPGRQERLLEEFNLVLGGVFQLPIYLPGTRHYKAVNAAGVIRRELLDVIERKRRRREMMGGCKEEEEEDLISHLMDVRGEGGKGLTDEEIADNILLLMDSGHDTSSSTMMMLVKYLAELPECYERVLAEQKEIALSKAPGELLNKDDIQKMKYSWNVVSEVLRLSPPIQGTFRRAIVDFSYAGFSIPKGWSVWWTVNSTHKSEEYFPEPEKFNPSRFEGDIPAPYTYVPFGGGPRMCPGREFARIEILVFLHNLVREFRWDLVFPNELITVEPMPLPSKGLPVYLHPHAH